MKKSALTLWILCVSASFSMAYSPAPIPDLNHTSLHEAADRCESGEARAALDAIPAAEKTEKINLLDREGFTPLAYAAQNGCMAVATLLVDAGADVSAAEDHTRWTPLHRAAQGGHADMVRYLAAHGADVNARTGNHRTPWTEAIRGTVFSHGPEGDRNATLAALLEKGAEPQLLDEEQQIRIEALQKEREAMAGEIERLREEIRRLNDVLDNIRSQAGGGEYRPT